MRILILVSALLISSPCLALTSAVDLNAPGDGLLTRDSDGMLDWLDITQTLNLSYNQTVAELGPGGLFEGFRYASLVEFEDFLISAGLDTAPDAVQSTNYSPALALIDLVGSTVQGNDDGFQGLTSERLVSGISVSSKFGERGHICFDCQAGTIDDLDQSGGYFWGHYLVRASVVPVPALSPLGILCLIASIGLAVLMARSSRTRRAVDSR
jgi:hypothetical protein